MLPILFLFFIVFIILICTCSTFENNERHRESMIERNKTREKEQNEHAKYKNEVDSRFDVLESDLDYAIDESDQRFTKIENRLDEMAIKLQNRNTNEQ